jgi:hypothetical protein
VLDYLLEELRAEETTDSPNDEESRQSASEDLFWPLPQNLWFDLIES